MDGTTYNIKIWKISVYKGKRKTTHTVRWELDGREWRAPFDTFALADAFRSDLVRATRRGEAFSPRHGASGLAPVRGERGVLVRLRRAVCGRSMVQDRWQQSEEHGQGTHDDDYRLAANATEQVPAG
ncbi:hypothetical protein [Streptomyces sp. NPDC056468]|uniref:hypothetical protein n=1 Tax=Streptomyces sp. NPDC056468 TaxID=3345830 RepID=UPI0036B55631